MGAGNWTRAVVRRVRRRLSRGEWRQARAKRARKPTVSCGIRTGVESGNTAGANSMDRITHWTHQRNAGLRVKRSMDHGAGAAGQGRGGVWVSSIDLAYGCGALSVARRERAIGQGWPSDERSGAPLPAARSVDATVQTRGAALPRENPSHASFTGGGCDEFRRSRCVGGAAGIRRNPKAGPAPLVFGFRPRLL